MIFDEGGPGIKLAYILMMLTQENTLRRILLLAETDAVMQCIPTQETLHPTSAVSLEGSNCP